MSKKLFKVLTIVEIVLAALLVLILVGTFVANSFAAAINSMLGATTYKVIREEPEEGEEIDTIHRKSAFDKYSDMKAWQEKIGAMLLEEGIVLYKNNGALPLTKGAKVNTIGWSSTNILRGGTGSGAVGVTTNSATGKQYVADLRDGLEYEGYLDVNDALFDYYKTTSGTRSTSNFVEPNVPAATIKSYCTGDFASGKAAIVVLSRTGGEGSDLSAYGGGNTRAGVEGNVLALHPSEITMLDQVAALKADGTFNKVIVLINTANSIQMDFLKIEGGKYNTLIDAIAWIGATGHFGTRGIGKVLCGEANFSGRTVDTVAYDNRTNPTIANFGTTRYSNYTEMGLTASTQYNYVVYAENVYLGYKYYETRYEDYVLERPNAGTFSYKDIIAYPFGHGLSYTTFEYTSVTGRRVGSGINTAFEIDVTVKNTGSRAGKHTVQVYAQLPYTQYDITNKVEKVSVQFAGFEKTPVIEPGQSKTVKIIVSEEEIISYDANNNKTYIFEPGDYYFSVGLNSHEAVNNILAAKGKTPANTANKMDAAGNANAVYKWTKTGSLELRDQPYAKNAAKDTKVTNQFDHADLLRSDIGGKSGFKYLTRNDWTGTFPVVAVDGGANSSNKASVQLSATEWMKKNGLVWTDTDFIESVAKNWETNGLTKDSEVLLEQPQYYSLVMMKDLPIDHPAWDVLLNQLSFEDMASTILNGQRQSRAIAAIGKPATIDHNGSVGMTQARLPVDLNWQAAMDPEAQRLLMGLASNDVSASTGNKQLIYLHGQAIGEDALYVGVAGLYGPGSNIHRSPYSGRNFEYVSEDGFITGVQVDYISRGMNSKGMYTFQKHALLNDQEAGRQGISTFVNEQAIRELYIKGQRDSFVKADQYLKSQETTNNDHINFTNFTFEEGLNWGVGIMSGYNRVGVLWNGHDYNLQENVFRKEFGGTGIIITDLTSPTGYVAPVPGVLGGTNLWDNSGNTSLFGDYKTDARLLTAMKSSLRYMCYTQANSMAVNGLSSADKIVNIMPWWQILLITVDSVLGGIVLLGAAGLIFVKFTKRIKV